MADYSGVIVNPQESLIADARFPIAGIGRGRSWLVATYAGVSPAICLPPGGGTHVYAAIDAGQSVTTRAYAATTGPCVLKILDRGGATLDAAYTTGHGAWETLSVALPAGLPKSIYLVEVASQAVHQDGPMLAHVGAIEVA